MVQDNQTGSGLSEDNRYTTWELKKCPHCGILILEHYSAVIVGGPEDAMQIAANINQASENVSL
jgi:hypothetical protein